MCVCGGGGLCEAACCPAAPLPCPCLPTVHVAQPPRARLPCSSATQTAATLLKGILLLLLLELASTPPALAFSWAQLTYAGATLAGYLLHFAPQYLRHLRAQGPPPGAAAAQPPERQGRGTKRGGREGAPALELDRPLLRLAGSFTLQAGEKLVLAEGSKMALTAATGPVSGVANGLSRCAVLCCVGGRAGCPGLFELLGVGARQGRCIPSTPADPPQADQGVYGLVANLGSLVVRTLFQPFEEAAFAAFSKARG